MQAHEDVLQVWVPFAQRNILDALVLQFAGDYAIKVLETKDDNSTFAINLSDYSTFSLPRPFANDASRTGGQELVGVVRH